MDPLPYPLQDLYRVCQAWPRGGLSGWVTYCMGMVTNEQPTRYMGWKHIHDLRTLHWKLRVVMMPTLSAVKALQPLVIQLPLWSGSHLNIKMVFAGMRISMLKIRRSQDCLIFNMGIPILVRRHLYIEMAPRFSVSYKLYIHTHACTDAQMHTCMHTFTFQYKYAIYKCRKSCKSVILSAGAYQIAEYPIKNTKRIHNWLIITDLLYHKERVSHISLSYHGSLAHFWPFLCTVVTICLTVNLTVPNDFWGN